MGSANVYRECTLLGLVSGVCTGVDILKVCRSDHDLCKAILHFFYRCSVAISRFLETDSPLCIPSLGEKQYVALKIHVRVPIYILWSTIYIE